MGLANKMLSVRRRAHEAAHCMTPFIGNTRNRQTHGDKRQTGDRRVTLSAGPGGRRVASRHNGANGASQGLGHPPNNAGDDDDGPRGCRSRIPALIQSDAFCLPDDLVKRAPRFSPLSQGRRRSAVESLVPGWPGHTRGTGARVGPPAAWPLSVGGLHHGARSRTGGMRAGVVARSRLPASSFRGWGPTGYLPPDIQGPCAGHPVPLPDSAA